MDEDTLEIFTALVKEHDYLIAEHYLTSAKQAVLNKAFPYDSSIEDIPPKYKQKVIEIAVYLYNKAGAEGETAHNENGISRSYESAGIPASMLRDIIPFAGVVKNEVAET